MSMDFSLLKDKQLALQNTIQQANMRGIFNLADKGVYVNSNATTTEIMDAILQISSGDGGGNNFEYEQITYNDDDTVTLIDKDGNVHTIVCKYEDGKISAITYNNEIIAIDYKDDDFILMEDTEIDLSKLKVESYIEQYTNIVFNDDNTIALTDKDGVEHIMSYIYENDKLKTVTYDGANIPVEYAEELLSKVGNTNIIVAQSQADRLYSHYGVDRAIYPYVAVCIDHGGVELVLKFTNQYSTDKFGGQYAESLSVRGSVNEYFPDHTNIEGVVSYVIEYMPKTLNGTQGAITSNSGYVWWSNIQADWIRYGTLYKMRENDISDIQNGFALGLATGGAVEIEIPAKEEQEKTITITENGTTEIVPDENKALSKVTVVTDVSGSSDISVEYIESTGTQYIDTGIIPTNHRVKMKFQCTSSENAHVFGSYGDKSSSINYNVYNLTWYEGLWYFSPHWSNGAQYQFSPSIQPTDVIEIDFNTYDKTIVINGVTNSMGTYGISRAVLPLYVFANNGLVTEGTSAKMKLWYAQIYDRDTQKLVRDFVPAVDKNGVICLYDNVTETYFYNQGSGEFIGGFIESELKELETLIDESGVLEDTEGTVTEKVEELIDKAKNGGSPSINENGIVSFGGNTTINENGIVSL